MSIILLALTISGWEVRQLWSLMSDYSDDNPPNVDDFLTRAPLDKIIMAVHHAKMATASVQLLAVLTANYASMGAK